MRCICLLKDSELSSKMKFSQSKVSSLLLSYFLPVSFFIFLLSVFFFDSGVLSSFQDELKQKFFSLQKIKNWQADFQEEIFEYSGPVKRREGRIIFSKPFNFKISYRGEEEVLSDGTFIYFVMKNKNKVYAKELKDEVSQNLLFELLRGSDKVFDFFIVKKVEEDVFELYPKKNVLKDVSLIRLYLNPIAFPIRKVEVIRGKFGVRLEIKNVSFKEEKIDFSFDGFKIIREPEF